MPALVLRGSKGVSSKTRLFLSYCNHTSSLPGHPRCTGRAGELCGTRNMPFHVPPPTQPRVAIFYLPLRQGVECSHTTSSREQPPGRGSIRWGPRLSPRGAIAAATLMELGQSGPRTQSESPDCQDYGLLPEDACTPHLLYQTPAHSSGVRVWY